MDDRPILATSFLPPFTVDFDPRTGDLSFKSGGMPGTDKDPRMATSPVGRAVAAGITVLKFGDKAHTALTDDNPNNVEQVLQAGALVIGDALDIPLDELIGGGAGKGGPPPADGPAPPPGEVLDENWRDP